MTVSKLITAFIAGIFFLTLSACNSVQIEREKLNQLIDSGNEIVEALEVYKESRSSLPETLSELVLANLLKSIPELGIEGNRFRNVRFNPVEELEYRVTVRLSKPNIFSLSDSSTTELTFRSDGKYESNRVEVHKIINGWALQTVYK